MLITEELFDKVFENSNEMIKSIVQDNTEITFHKFKDFNDRIWV